MVDSKAWIGLGIISLIIILTGIGYQISDKTHFCQEKGIVMECLRFSSSGNRCYPNLLDNKGYVDCSNWIKLKDYIEKPISNKITIPLDFGQQEYKTGEFIVSSQTGIDSYYDVSFTHLDGQNIRIDYCLTDEKLKELQKEKEYENYKVPTTIKSSKTDSFKSKVDSQIEVKLVIDKDSKTSNCIELIENPYLVDEIKLGSNSTYIISAFTTFSEAILTNVTVEANFSHLDIIGDTSSPWRGFNYTTREAQLPYFQDDDNSYGSFDGSSGYVTINNKVTNFNESFTVSFWTNHGSSSSYQMILYSDQSSQFYMGFNTGTIFQCSHINSTGSQRAFPITGAGIIRSWNHYTLVTNVSGDIFNQTFYRNGVPIGYYRNTEGVGAYTGTKLYFSTSANSWFVNGSLDNILILNRSLNSTEVTSLYNLGRKDTTYTDTSLVSAWRFDNTNISVAQDTIGPNNGTFVNGTQYGYDNFGLVAYYPFDVQENTANNVTYDYSKNNNDGTLTNTTWNNTCVYGGCYQFTGIVNYINTGKTVNTLIGASDFSLSVWYKTNSTSLEGIMGTYVDSETSGLWLFQIGNILTARIKGSGTASGMRDINYALSPNNLWYNVIVIGNRTGNMTMYVNGLNAGTKDITMDNGTLSTSNFVIGIGTTTSYKFNGSIDEVMIFNTALNSSQISDIYNNQSKRFKSQGTQTIKQVNITSGYNQVNLSTSFNAFFGSNISARLGAWDAGSCVVGSGSSVGGSAYKDYDLGTHWAEFNTSSYVDVGSGSSLNITNQVTISVWVKSFQPNKDIIDKIVGGSIGSGKQGFGLFLDANGKPYAFVEDTGGNNSGWSATTGTPSINDSNWHYLVGTIDLNGDILKTYVDAINYSAINLSSIGDITNTWSLTIGKAIKKAYFNGSIDEVMIWNKSLSSSEIANIYSQGRDISYYDDASLVSWWGFDNGNSKDKKGNNSGTDTAVVYNQSNSLTNGLVSYYHFDEASWNGTTGEVKDAMGRNNGTAQNSTGRANTTTNGVYFRGGSFDGVNGYVNLTSSSSNLNYSQGSLGFWVKSSSDTSQTLFSVGNYSGTYLFAVFIGDGVTGTLTNELITIARDDGSVGNRVGYTSATRTELFNNQWHQVIVTANGTNYTIYLDGVSKTLSVGTGANNGLFSNLSISNNAFIGVKSYSSAGLSMYANNSIDEIMIFNRSLSSDEVKELYVKGRANWNYTTWQNLSANGNVWNMSTSTTNLLPDFSMFAGNSTSNAFYTPNLISSAGITLITIDNVLPLVNITYPVNGTTYTYGSRPTSINYTSSDLNPSVCWYNLNNGVNSSTQNYSTNWTIDFSAGSVLINVFCNDTNNNIGNSNINIIITESVPPTYSNISVNPSSPIMYYSDVNFNITWIDNVKVDTAILSFNNINYTMSNLSNVYYKTLIGLSAGIFNYSFLANDSSNNFNQTISYSYTIDKNSSYILSLNSSSGWTIPASTYSTITGSSCPSQLTCNLYQSGVNQSNPFTNIFPAGIYSFVYNTTGNTNYTSYSVSNILNSLVTNNFTVGNTTNINFYTTYNPFTSKLDYYAGSTITGNLTIGNCVIGINKGLITNVTC